LYLQVIKPEARNMCGLLTIASSEAESAGYDLLHSARSVLQQSRQAPDGYGIWTVEGTYVREPRQAAESPMFISTAQDVETRLLLAHVRRRTVGPRDLAHTQPFTFGAITVVNGGGIGAAWHQRIRRELGRQNTIQGATSGEYLAHWLGYRFRRTPFLSTILDAFRELIASPDGITSATCLVAVHAGAVNDATLLGFNFSPAGDTFFPLYCARRKRSLVIATSSTTRDETWDLVPNRAVLITSPRSAPAVRIFPVGEELPSCLREPLTGSSGQGQAHGVFCPF
jgi:glutamine phosphoribosylpyrophosphate amidotransferase